MSNKAPSPSPFGGIIRKSWQVMLVMSILEILLGIAVMAWPGASLLIIAAMFGAFLIISGISELVVGLSTPQMSSGFRILNVIAGVLSILLGVLCFRGGVFGSLELLGIWVGAGWLMAGFSRLFVFGSLDSMPGKRWAMAGAAITIVAGIVAIVWPVSSVVTLAFMGGIALIVVGGVSLVQALQWKGTVNAVS